MYDKHLPVSEVQIRRAPHVPKGVCSVGTVLTNVPELVVEVPAVRAMAPVADRIVISAS